MCQCGSLVWKENIRCLTYILLPSDLETSNPVAIKSNLSDIRLIHIRFIKSLLYTYQPVVYCTLINQSIRKDEPVVGLYDNLYFAN